MQKFEEFIAEAAQGELSVADLTVTETDMGALFNVEIWFMNESRILRAFIELPEEVVQEFEYGDLPMKKLTDYLKNK